MRSDLTSSAVKGCKTQDVGSAAVRDVIESARAEFGTLGESSRMSECSAGGSGNKKNGSLHLQ